MTLAGSRVQFADGATGVISPEKWDELKKDPELAKLYIDVGATNHDEARGRLGQAAGFQRPFATSAAGQWPRPWTTASVALCSSRCCAS